MCGSCYLNRFGPILILREKFIDAEQDLDEIREFNVEHNDSPRGRLIVALSN
jgi:hypothetical protein